MIRIRGVPQGVILKQTTGTRSSQWVFGTNGHVDEENAFASLASFEGVARIHGRGIVTVVCWFVLGVAVCIVALSTPGFVV